MPPSLRSIAIALILAGLATVAQAAGGAAGPVDVNLVLAVDVSESIDADEYNLQHEGIARAFEDRRTVDAIHNGPHGAIDVLVMEWSNPEDQQVTVDWTRISDAESATVFAAKVRASQRSSKGLTAIGNALLAAGGLLENAPDRGDRRVIDVSGDGIANIGPQPSQVRDTLVAAGVTINGLAILKTEPWLDQYYENDVIGGEQAFMLKVEDFRSFATAMQQKLLSEIAARPSPRRAAFYEVR
jgi:hypothetical protein